MIHYDELELLEVEEVIEEEKGTDEKHKLVVYNDDVNTFDWVIESFVEICYHTQIQAEQCALIIHFNGKSSVKSGSKKFLKPMKDALTERGINAVIEK